MPRDHPLSNVKPFDDILLGSRTPRRARPAADPGVPIPLENIHPFPTGEAIGRGRGRGWCAATLADELRADGLSSRPTAGRSFDLMLLGIGGDGHMLSVFPGSAAFDSTELALAIPAPTHIEPHVERVTLNPAIVGVARHVLVVAYGADKAADPRRGLRPGTRSPALAGPARAARPGRPGSSTRRPPRSGTAR